MSGPPPPSRHRALRAARRCSWAAGVLVAVAAALVGACGSRRPVVRPPKLTRLPPAPPGSVVVFGPVKIEAIDAVRSEIGWERELVRGTRVVAYDVTLSQERAICPAEDRGAITKDAEGCEGTSKAGARCRSEAPVRARTEVVVTWSIDVSQRCAGDTAAYALAATSDARSTLTTAGIGCFKSKNKYKPESTWASIYAITEVGLEEKLVSVETTYPALLSALFSKSPSDLFCREDGAYLDGSAGRAATKAASTVNAKTLLPSLLERAPLGGELPAPSSPVKFESEHALWEACNAAPAKEAVVAQERCQLVRQIDKLLRDIEETARPETPRGAAPASSSGGAP